MSEYKLKSKQQTTIQSNLNVPIIKDLILPLPPLRKQREIVSILSLIDEKVSINERKLKNYEKLRKGISNKLLLGEITL